MDPLACGPDVFNRYSCDLGHILKTVFFLHHTGFEILITQSAGIDELFIFPSIFDDVLHHPVKEGNICTRVVLDVEMCLFGGGCAARVTYNDLCTVALCLHQLAASKRASLKVVAADDKCTFSVSKVAD